jgi:hypothetical protein
MLSEKLQIRREKLELLYSIAVLIIIPVLLAANTLLLIQGMRRNYDTELRRKADLANGMLGVGVVDRLDDPTAVQAPMAISLTS